MRIYVFKKRNLYILAAILIVVILGLILLWQFTKDKTVSSLQLKYTYSQILPEEAQLLMSNNPEVVILDVRDKKDYDKGHIKDAIAIPYKNLRGQLDELDYRNTYLIYCNTGKDSAKASKIMAESGYPRVFSLVGGYKKWPYEIKK
ncbi:rhodanese-like domain-containing protein [Alkaliphilus peptidifermentans]|uniref:Rhodanese-related sulfurtransferase n=1 Tax=Alkaliphilus peptidifermentans DSM 18978 TaxID=1120976 RepID=A0A1G5AMS0_9FIRM|nr:rhodanese-like domain-containing protein [Alkaliphilus peptidifermentans]SCX79179.1 Rhodanese-related sulfurtransferase [Alkaliphilus peptidifermentans DSM 18978]